VNKGSPMFAKIIGHAQVRIVLLVPMTICVADMLFLALLHLRTTIFDTAFLLLEENLSSSSHAGGSRGQSAPRASSNARNVSWFGAVMKGIGLKQLETDADAGFFTVPVWIWWWIVAQALGGSFDLGILALACYFGDDNMTHELVLLALLASASGQCALLFLRRTRWLDFAPMHALIIACWYIRVFLGALLGATLAGIFAPSFGFLQVLWFAFHFNSVMQGSLTDATTTSSFVPGSMRESVANISSTCDAVSMLAGLGGALFVSAHVSSHVQIS